MYVQVIVQSGLYKPFLFYKILDGVVKLVFSKSVRRFLLASNETVILLVCLNQGDE